MRQVGNDDLSYVYHSYDYAHHWSRNFEKLKMCRTNSNFEKFENNVNLLYTVCAMSEMMISAMFAIVIIMLEISKKSNCAEPTAISKSLKTL